MTQNELSSNIQWVQQQITPSADEILNDTVFDIFGFKINKTERTNNEETNQARQETTQKD